MTSSVPVSAPYTLVNGDNSQCLSQIWTGNTQWPGFNLQGCTGNEWQQIRYNSDKSMTTGVGGYLINDNSNNVGSAQDGGTARNSGWMYNVISAVPNHTSLTGDAALQYGPVLIQEVWPTTTGVLDQSSGNNNVRFNWPNGGKSQTWISKALNDVCSKLGIPVGECTQDSINSCSYPAKSS